MKVIIEIIKDKGKVTRKNVAVSWTAMQGDAQFELSQDANGVYLYTGHSGQMVLGLTTEDLRAALNLLESEYKKGYLNEDCE